jgi:hypothetical protein
MTLISADISDSGRVYVKAIDTTGAKLAVDQGESIQRKTRFEGQLTQGVTGRYQITNYHFSDDYRVSTWNGVVSLDDDEIVYTPETVGSGGFFLNGTRYVLEVLPEGPLKPSIFSPTNGQQGLSKTPTVVSNSFDTEEAGLTHHATRWQIATDAAFTNIVVDETSTTSLLTYTVEQLESEGEYYVRIQHIGYRAD